MEARLKCRICRTGILFPTSTTIYHCYNCKSVVNSHPTGEAKVTCKGCGGGFMVPKNTAAYRCSICQTLTTSISGYEQPSQDSQMHSKRKKLGSILFKHDWSDTSHRSSSSSSSTWSIGSPLDYSSRCNKRALLCGVTYKKRKYKLKGTVNDVLNMKEMLIKIFEFPRECIRVLTEDQQNPDLVPTKKNILESLHWLVKDCQKGDSLVFYFSGHGVQQPDLKEDEIDGFDETLCPVDFVREGMIVDNDLNSIMVWPLKKGVTLHAIVDSCHSGTILDLAYVYKLENGEWEDNKPPAKVPMRKHTSGGLAICFSACQDNQMAADTTAFGKKGMNGVMTYLFIKTIKQNPDITYGGILKKMHEEIEKIKMKQCHPKILKRMFRTKIAQDPIISSSEKFDVFKRIFTL